MFRLVWSDARQAYVTVAEFSSGKGKRSSGVVGTVAAVMLGFAGQAHALDPGALPDGANITHGQANISQSGNVMNIHQSTDKLITNWQTFNIGEQATVNFHQPGANSAALNRVLDQNPSQILGNLNANGQVYLINPSGIVFGHNAQVDVGGLIASTLDIADQDFIDGKLNFQNLGFSNGEIKNLGHIKANGGVVAFIANRVSNHGTLEANNGDVALAAGDHVTLDFSGDGLMTVTVEQGVLDALAENGGLIQADGGFVIMTTQAQNDIYRNVVNNDGVIQAQTLASQDGKIMLMGGMSQGQVVAGGTLDASAPTEGDGGFVETSAAEVNLQPDLVVTTRAEAGETGEWLIDPTDIEIVAGSGGDFSTNPVTGSTIGADTLVNNLANNNITVKTADEGAGEGTITINADIEWDENTQLTLSAHGNIYVNARIANTNTSGGGVYFVDPSLNDHPYPIHSKGVVFSDSGTVVIHNTDQLQTIRVASQGRFELGSDIDASSISSWTPGSTPTFSGQFDGRGHSIENLTLDNVTDRGLFIATNGARIQNVKLVNVNVDIPQTHLQVGALVGSALNTHIENVSVTGNVAGATTVGGLVGGARGITMLNSSSSATISGKNVLGGLVGEATDSKILDSFSTGNVTGSPGEKFIGTPSAIGGLAGWIHNVEIENSYATGNVIANNEAGGLVGIAQDGSKIIGSYATGNVTPLTGLNSEYGTGGLVGVTIDTLIHQSYATGDVTGSVRVGGLVGHLTGSTISQSYATGDVTGRSLDTARATDIGGLVGAAGYYYITDSDSVIENSYAVNTVVTEETANVGGLVGVLSGSGLVKNSYAVSKNDSDRPGLSLVGRAVSADGAAISNSYYDVTVSKQLDSKGGEPKTTEAMQSIATYSNGSDGDWAIVEDPTLAKGTPVLAWTLGRDSSVWIIGTGEALPEPTPDPTPNPTPDPGPEPEPGVDPVPGPDAPPSPGTEPNRDHEDVSLPPRTNGSEGSNAPDLEIFDNSGVLLLASLSTNNLFFDREVTLEGLPVFNSTKTQTTLDSVVTVESRGASFSLKHTNKDTAAIATPNLATAVILAETQTEIKLDNGTETLLTVKFNEDGTLLGEVSGEVLEIDQNRVVLAALAAAKRIGVSLERITGVVIHHS